MQGIANLWLTSRKVDVGDLAPKLASGLVLTRMRVL